MEFSLLRVRSRLVPGLNRPSKSPAPVNLRSDSHGLGHLPGTMGRSRHRWQQPALGVEIFNRLAAFTDYSAQPSHRRITSRDLLTDPRLSLISGRTSCGDHLLCGFLESLRLSSNLILCEMGDLHRLDRALVCGTALLDPQPDSH